MVPPKHFPGAFREIGSLSFHNYLDYPVFIFKFPGIWLGGKMEAMNWIPHVDLQVVGLVLASGFILNISALVVYRLLFHPLRRVPGPFFAGITYGYQMYYDVYLGGQMPRRLVDLHQKYGPIVRIAPDRVHVNDPEFYKRYPRLIL